MQAWLTVVRRTDSELYTAATTLVEVADVSPRDAAVRRVMKAVVCAPISDEICYLAGRLRAAAAAHRRKQRDLTADALLAAVAVGPKRPTLVLASDPNDLQILLQDKEIGIVTV